MSAESQHSEASPQHTPSPWHRCEAQPDAIVGPRCIEGMCNQCDEVQSATWGFAQMVKTYGHHFGGHFVCESVSSTANFNLITAAPDLLAALKSLLVCVDMTENPEVGFIRMTRPMMEKLDGLVGKAEGRQP